MGASTIPAALAEAAAGPHGQAVAILEHDGWTLTYAALEGAALAMAGVLIELGVEPGEAVALWGPNSAEWAVAQQAVLAIGARVVPLNTRYTSHEAGDIVARAACRVAFVAPDSPALSTRVTDTGGTYRPYRSRQREDVAADVECIALAGRCAGPDGEGWNDDWVALLDAGTAHLDEVLARRAALTADDVSHIQFTSGTTGRPKGAMLRHGAMVATSRLWAAAAGLRAGDRYPVIAPFAHLGGHKTGLLTSSLVGATVIPVGGLRPDAFAELIHRVGATFMQGPPTIFHDLVARHRCQPGSVPALRVGVTGGAVVPPSLVRSMREELGVAQVHTAYGLTESTGVVTITAAGDDFERIATTVGRPLPSVQVRIVDDAGNDVPMGDPGEVLVAGASVMAGYLDDPAATAAAVVDGWLHTGDVGVLDDGGNLRIVDRMTEMIAVGGLNVYPTEVEHVLLAHPAVAAIAVVGAADARLGEVPVAFVVPSGDGLDADNVADELAAWAADRLARFKLPRRFTVVDQLPLNAAGKVAKAELRDRVRGGH